MTLKRDWSDWLSPVVVKEIRQGVRGKVFVGAFLITQLMMVFLIFVGLMQATGRNDLGVWSGFFWTAVGLPLLIIMPARGLQAVGSEIRDGTIDLVFLSRLSAWRIVIGKWAALSAQSVLLVSSLLPYIVLRYFIGTVNLLQDLLILGLILAGSALLCAGSVALSAFQPKGRKGSSIVGGIIIFFLAIFGAWVLAIVLFGLARGSGRGGMSASDFLDIYLTVGLLGPIFGIFLLQFGASKIAPAAENHALRKRLTAVAAFGLAAGLSFFDVARPLPFVFACGILGISVIDAVCQPIPRIYSIYVPFVKRGALGRLIGIVFYPGWASGSIFAFVAISGIYIWAALHPDISRDLEWKAYMGTLGIVFFPLALIRLVKPKLERSLAAYCAIQAIIAVITSVAVVISEVLKNHVLSQIISVIPLSFVIVDSSNVRGAEAVFYTGGTAVLVVSCLILLWRIIGAFADMRGMLAEFDTGKAAPAESPPDDSEGHSVLPAQSFRDTPPPLPSNSDAGDDADACS